MEAFAGNSADRCVLTDHCCGDSAWSRKSSRVGCSIGTGRRLGPVKMTFSVLATAVWASSRDKRKKKSESMSGVVWFID